MKNNAVTKLRRHLSKLEADRAKAIREMGLPADLRGLTADHLATPAGRRWTTINAKIRAVLIAAECAIAATDTRTGND